MLRTFMNLPVTELPQLAETIDHLRTCASLDGPKHRRQWLDILGVNEKDYKGFIAGKKPLPDAAVESLAKHLGLDADDVWNGTVDFKSVAVKQGNGSKELPERYAVAAFSRRRTTITSFDYIEKTLGWRARMDALRHLQVNESVLSDHMAPINNRFFTDAANYLCANHGLGTNHLFEMGVHSSVANRKTLIGSALSASRNLMEAYLIFGEDLMRFFENHTRYAISFLREDSCTIDAFQMPYIAEAMGAHNFGSLQICATRGGMIASIPRYLNKPLAKVSEILCVHRGDHFCRYHVEFPKHEVSSDLAEQLPNPILVSQA